MKKLLIVFVLILSILNANIDEAKKVYADKDFKKAFPMFEKLQKEGNIESNYYLGNMYQYGNGVKQDFKKAFKHYTLASSQDNEKSLKSTYYIAIMYMNGQGVQKNSKKVFSLLKVADFDNVGVAQYILGVMYEEGEGIQKDLKKALLQYKKACNSKKKYPKACYYAGDYYEKGIAVEENYSTAKEYYKKACDAGIQESCAAIKNMKEPKSFYRKYYWYIFLPLLLLSWWRLWDAKKNKKGYYSSPTRDSKSPRQKQD